jgi:hypothetical protein
MAVPARARAVRSWLLLTERRGHETHGSWVFIAGHHVLKIQRPVELSFLDYSTLESLARARERIERMRESDATATIAKRLGAQFAALDEIPAPLRHVLPTDRTVEAIVDD